MRWRKAIRKRNSRKRKGAARRSVGLYMDARKNGAVAVVEVEKKAVINK